MASKNKFEQFGDNIHITWTDSDENTYLATTTLRDDYADELKSVTWGVNSGYFYNAKLGYLHRYIVGKWYGEQILNAMKNANFVVDHMDNHSFNCNIENLSFLSSDENKAKGFTVDKQTEELRWNIALNMFKDFSTGFYQMTVAFNTDMFFRENGSDKAYKVAAIKLLYNNQYEIVINDARDILLKYKSKQKIDLNKLNFIDIKIEKATSVILPQDYEGVGVYIDGVFHLIINENCRIDKINYDKGWMPREEGE